MSVPLIRNAPPKFPKDPLPVERAKKRQARMSHEKSEKAKVRTRDRHCRWPNCVCRSMRLTAEVAHLDDKGMGGDHGVRTSADAMILLCHLKHRGPTSLHSGDCRIERLTPAGTDGPCAFYEGGQLVGRERAVGILERLS